MQVHEVSKRGKLQNGCWLCSGNNCRGKGNLILLSGPLDCAVLNTASHTILL